jgi:hypothetical protein
MYVELLVGEAFNTSVPVTEDLQVLIRENKRENDEFSNLPKDGEASYTSPSWKQPSIQKDAREMSGSRLVCLMA